MGILARALLAFSISSFCIGSAAAEPPLGAPLVLPVDGGPTGIATADVDADGAPDLITLNEAGEDGPSLSVLLNNGNGSFRPEERLNLPGSRYLAAAMTAADFDGDGYGDLAVAVNDIRTFPPVAAVLVYRSAGDGQFKAPKEYLLSGVLPACINAGDLDHDGRIDLVVCHADGSDGSGALSVLRGDSGGAFAVSARIPLGVQPSQASIADVDGDGSEDVLVVDPAAEALFVIYGSADAAAALEPVAIRDIGTPSSVRLRPREGGLSSLLVTNVTGGELLTLEQVAPREFQVASSQLLDSAPSALSLLDTDGDGNQLAAVASFAADIVGVIALGSEAMLQSSLLAAPSDLLSTDLNRDGRVDLATTSLTGDGAAVFLAGSDPAPTPTPGAGEPQQTPSAEATSTSLIVTATPRRTPTATPTCAGGTCSGISTPTRTSQAVATPTATATATAIATRVSAVAGDANCDGSVDQLDGYAIIEQLFLHDCDGADLNGDGMVTSADVILFFMDGEAP